MNGSPEPESLEYDDQIRKFMHKGMNITVDKLTVKTFSNVGYYKIKEFAEPLAKLQNSKVSDYSGLEFKWVISRYFQNKNLRIYLLHAIQDIEQSLATKISFILGKKYGAYGYLKFNSWGNREKYGKYYLNDHERNFKNMLRKKKKQSTLPYLKQSKNQKRGFPTIWLAIDTLSFGDLKYILMTMSRTNLKVIAASFNCTGKELVSWIGCLNLIRNWCCHNENIIDVDLKIKPLIPEEYKDFLLQNNGNGKIAVVAFIILHFMNSINQDYKKDDIFKSFSNLCRNEEMAKYYGFSEKKSVQELRQPTQF